MQKDDRRIESPVKWWYNLTTMKNLPTERYYTPIQIKIPVDLEKIIKISDGVYSFREVTDHIDLEKYIVKKGNEKGRPRYDRINLLKNVLFAHMEYGNPSTRFMSKLCVTDIRFMWLLGDTPAPSHMTLENFMKNELVYSMEEIFADINRYIFSVENVDTNHTYIDGTKIEANANKYTWVWKKSCITNRNSVFGKITLLLKTMNEETFTGFGISADIRQEYAIEYLEMLLNEYKKYTGIDESEFVHGSGKRKTTEQKRYETLLEYIKRLKRYSHHIKICGDKRNSYSKTDTDATFLRMKKDYMGNDQLLPGYNYQIAVCDEYIAAYDVKQFASDMDCFIPLMNRFNDIYNHYPLYPTADAGYGCLNNYLFCQEHGMGKYMKFTMYDKTINDEKYREDPFRAVNFKINENGKLVCPAGKEFHYLYSAPVKGNNYGRTEEYYQCKNCQGCSLKEKCHKSKNNRIIRINQELTSIHKEVIDNLNSVHGALLRINRSIQAEGTFGTIKGNRGYKRDSRRGLKMVLFEFSLICCGFNLRKFHNNRLKQQFAA